MKPHQIHIPTEIYFGRNIWEASLKEIGHLLNGTILIATTGRSLERLGYLGKLKSELEKYALEKKVVVFDKVSPNPKLSEVREGVEAAKKCGAEVIVGFGGGSAIDMAKAIAAGAQNKRDIGQYFYDNIEPEEGILPVIAVPTTAGTGSELSKAAIITDEKTRIKSGIRGRKLYPKAAIVDSVFTESVPFEKTMQTGFDVLAHAMESTISKAASPYTQMQSEYAIKTVGRMLPRLALNLQDIEARKQMSYVSMLMGINLGNASTGLPHRLQYPLGAFTDTSHGMGLAALYPAWIDYEYQYSREKVERMISILAGASSHEKETCVYVIKNFIASLKLPVSLKEMGIEKASVKEMAESVTGNLLNDPASQEPDIIQKIYKRALEGV